MTPVISGGSDRHRENAGRVEHDRGRATLIRDDAGVETRASGGVFVAVDVDERDGLTDIDGQLARNEIARVVADDANFQRFRLQFDDSSTFLRGCAAAASSAASAAARPLVFRVSGSAVVVVVPAAPSAPTVTRAVVVVLRKRERAALVRCGLEQQQAAAAAAIACAARLRFPRGSAWFLAGVRVMLCSLNRSVSSTTTR